MGSIGDHMFVSGPSGARGLVVFVHGLGGSMKRTWGRLPALINQPEAYDVMLWTYPSFLVGHVPPVHRAGGLLLSRLRQDCSNYQNIVLVGHSLGCLVIESAITMELRLAEDSSKPVSQVKYTVLYAPPHAGHLAARLVRRIPYLTNAQLQFLGTGNEDLIVLQREWVNRVYSAADHPKTGMSMQIPMAIIMGSADRLVSPVGAQFVYGDRFCTLLDRGHFSIKNPVDAADETFILLRGILDQVSEGSR